MVINLEENTLQILLFSYSLNLNAIIQICFLFDYPCLLLFEFMQSQSYYLWCYLHGKTAVSMYFMGGNVKPFLVTLKL